MAKQKVCGFCGEKSSVNDPELCYEHWLWWNKLMKEVGLYAKKDN